MIAHRVDRLVRRAAGDQRVPAGERPGASSIASMAATIAGGSAMRPGPNSPCRPSRPSSGPIAARRAPRASPGWPGSPACSHMRTFIAGATSIGLSVASSARRGQVVGQAGRHLRQHVGGRRRHHHQVGVLREAGCGPSRSRRSARTGREDPPAGQGLAPTAGSRTGPPPRVRMQRTSAPRSRRRRIKSSDLYAAMPPVMISSTRRSASDMAAKLGSGG